MLFTGHPGCVNTTLCVNMDKKHVFLRGNEISMPMIMIHYSHSAYSTPYVMCSYNIFEQCIVGLLTI